MRACVPIYSLNFYDEFQGRRNYSGLISYNKRLFLICGMAKFILGSLGFIRFPT